VTVRRGLVASWLSLAAVAVSSDVVLAHTITGRVNVPLPFVVYLAGAALAVALSFAFVAFTESSSRDRASTAPPSSRQVPGWLRAGLKAIGLVGWLWIVAQTIAGGASDADVASLFLWTYGWVGIAAVCALVGPLWAWIDPFSTLYDLLAGAARRLGVALADAVTDLGQLSHVDSSFRASGTT
jgi:hypothetical protein